MIGHGEENRQKVTRVSQKLTRWEAKHLEREVCSISLWIGHDVVHSEVPVDLTHEVQQCLMLGACLDMDSDGWVPCLPGPVSGPRGSRGLLDLIGLCLCKLLRYIRLGDGNHSVL